MLTAPEYGGGVVLATHQRHPRVEPGLLDNIVLEVGVVEESQ